MKNLLKCPKNIDYTTVSLLDYSYHQNYYKLIGIDLSRQTNIRQRQTTIPQQDNYREKLEEGDGAKMFFITEKQQKSILSFFFFQIY